MKRMLFWGLCLVLAGGGLAFGQDKMIITYKNGTVQAIDIKTISKIEYESSQAAANTGQTSLGIHGQTASFQSYNFQDHYIRHANWLGELTPISSELDRKDSTFKIVPGLADGQLVSFEAVNYPGHYLRHQDFRLKLQKSDGSQLFKADATFRVPPGLADGSWSSFESLNYPGLFVRTRDFHLYLEKGNDDLFKKDSTFRVTAPKF
jgi:hypothetical protein